VGGGGINKMEAQESIINSNKNNINKT